MIRDLTLLLVWFKKKSFHLKTLRSIITVQLLNFYNKRNTSRYSLKVTFRVLESLLLENHFCANDIIAATEVLKAWHSRIIPFTQTRNRSWFEPTSRGVKTIMISFFSEARQWTWTWIKKAPRTCTMRLSQSKTDAREVSMFA